MQLKPDHDLPGSAIAALEAVVLDDIVMPKVPVKSALFVAGKGEPNRNIRPYPVPWLCQARRSVALASTSIANWKLEEEIPSAA